MIFKNNVVIVTGGINGLGKYIVDVFFKSGSNVVIADIDIEKSINHRITNYGDNQKKVLIKTDVSKSDDVKRLISKAMKLFGRIDVLINNAAIMNIEEMDEINEKNWDRVMNINLKGPFLCCKEVIPIFIKQMDGKIINVSSNASKTGGVLISQAYCASKAGINGLTISLAKRLAKFNINVNAVAPGPMDTEGFKKMCSTQPKNFIKQLISGIPLGRLIDPEDVANAILYLCSENAKNITGEILDINGGLIMD